MGRFSRIDGDSRIHGLAAIENFLVNSPGNDAHRCERLLHVVHEARRPTKVDFRVSWNSELFKRRLRDMPFRVEILPRHILQAWLAIANPYATVGQREHKAADISSKWVMFAIARSV